MQAEITALAPIKPGTPDDVFITCVGFEERCLGVPRRFADYSYRHAFVFTYEQANDSARAHLSELQGLLHPRGPYLELSTSEFDPVPAVAELSRILNTLIDGRKPLSITLDISVLAKSHVLFLLRALDLLHLLSSVRVLYTEPGDYNTDLYVPTSRGIRHISPVPGFVNTGSLGKPLLLIVFLGYEGDRASALVRNLEPHETLLVIPEPPYRPEWKGRTEEMNKHLITSLRRERLYTAHSTDPEAVAQTLASLLAPGSSWASGEWNVCIAPLGTKPQTVGVYLYCRGNPGQCSLVNAQPLKHSSVFNIMGVGRTWPILFPSQT